MPQTRIVVGNSAKKLLDLIRGTIAGADQTYPGLAHGNGCQYLRIEAAANITYIGDNSTVSATNNGGSVDAAAGNVNRLYERESANGYNNIPLNIWVIGDNAASAIRITFQYA